MIKHVLITSLIVFIIALIVFWLMTGGGAAVARTARTLMNPLDFFIGQNTSVSFIQLPASDINSASVSIAGWSLQSAVSGARAAVPQAAPLFVLGIVNSVQGISLEPGASVVLTTAASPVGTSFRENRCIGYLNELQIFTPELSGSCPTPSEALPMN